MKIAALLPKPFDQCGSTLFAIPLHENDHEGDARVDYQVSDKQSLFVRNMLVKNLIAVPYTIDPSNVLVAGGVGHNDQFEGFTIGDTYLLSGTKVNSFRLYLNRVSAIILGADMFGPQDVGINAFTYQPKYLTIPVSGAFSLGSGNFSENSFAYTTGFGAKRGFPLGARLPPICLRRILYALHRMVRRTGVVRWIVHNRQHRHGPRTGRLPVGRSYPSFARRTRIR